MHDDYKRYLQETAPKQFHALIQTDINIFHKGQHQTVHNGAENFKHKSYVHRKLSKKEGTMVGRLWRMLAVNLQSDMGSLEQEPSLALRQNK
jgi:hypothetical protein